MKIAGGAEYTARDLNTPTFVEVGMPENHSSRLTVLGPGKRKYHLLCRCECGVEKEVQASRIRSRRTKSCGCLVRELAVVRGRANKRHGMTNTRTHRVWAGMKNRCCNQKDRQYHDYGGRGIAVCARWKVSFVNFLADMGECPGTHYSIDRLDNNGNYEPGNCRWATGTQQCNNRRNNRNLTAFGRTHTLTEWARIRELTHRTLDFRIQAGWEVERALMTPARVAKGPP